MSNMQRAFSSSSHVTESSQTTNYIHSQIGDSISPSQNVAPSYLRHDSDAFFWNNGQVHLEDDNAFITNDHRLLPPETPLPPQLILSPNEGTLNIDSSVNDADALFDYIISRMQQEYSTQPDRLTYARRLARTYLGLDSIPSFAFSREQPSRNSQLGTQLLSSENNTHIEHILNTNSDGVQRKEQYVCLLCPSPVRVICSRGSFKRHVNEMHQSKSLFLCMHCEWSHCRKDKLRDHLRVRHPREGGHTAQEIKERELMLPLPSTCDLCGSYESPIHEPPFQSWEAWFECIETHCRIDDDEDKKPESKPNFPDQNDGNAGGAAGGFFPNTPFPKEPNSRGAPSMLGNSWLVGVGSLQWAFNTQTRSGFRESRQGLLERTSGLNAGSIPGISSPKNLTESNIQIFKKEPSTENGPVLEGLVKHVSVLYLDYKPKAIAKTPGDQTPSLTQNGSQINEKSILEKSTLISDVVHELNLVSVVYLINQISLHSHGGLCKAKLEDYANFVAVNALAIGEETLHRIHYNNTNSRLHQLGLFRVSLDVIHWELSDSPLSSHATSRQRCRRKRLSFLWARLRAITFVLSLQKDVMDKEAPITHPHIAESKLSLMNVDRNTAPPSTVYKIQSLYNLVQKYLSEPYNISHRGGIPTFWKPTMENSLGVSDLSDFLQALTSSISMPKPSLVESSESTDLYGLLDHSRSGISTAAF